MRPAALLLPLALAACGLGDEAPAGPASARCEAQADSDPAVVAATLRANSELQEVRVPGVRDLNNARRRAVARCLSGNGAAGGVEPVQTQ